MPPSLTRVPSRTHLLDPAPPDSASTTLRGRARVTFLQRDGRTRLGDLEQHTPLRVLFPRPGAGDIAQAFVTNVSGGIVAGDALEIAIEAGPGSRCLVGAQAAEKVYRSLGPRSYCDVELRAGSDSWLEWLPQETIVFDAARFHRRTRMEVAPGARLLAGEWLVLGRVAHGENISRLELRERLEVRREGRLAWADCLRVDESGMQALAHPACLDGARALASVVYVGEDAERHLEAARAFTKAEGCMAGASLVDGVLVARWLAARPLDLRRALAHFWTNFRALAAGLPRRLPRIWHV